MKKSFIFLMLSAAVIAVVLAACSAENGTVDNTAGNTSDSSVKADGESGLADADTEFELTEVPVTDEDGKSVTDEDGNVKTELRGIRYETDENGKTVGYFVDSSGEEIIGSDGQKVTVTQDDDNDNNNNTTTTKKANNDEDNDEPTATTDKHADPTDPTEPTYPIDSDVVPGTDDDGNKVNFSVEDQEIIADMLEVPYLYHYSYENRDSVPIEAACHVALWMTERENISSTSYPSGTIVLDLFHYFGQTVVNFKPECNNYNSDNNSIQQAIPITYNSSSDTFTITGFEESTHTVKIKDIYSLGGSYYKVEAKVSGCNKKKVTAVIQKNQLDKSLGFSVKALQWS